MNTDPTNRLQALRRRFARPVFRWAAIALVLELLIQRSSSRSSALALVPLIPMFLFIVSLVQTIRKMDELQQRISLLSMSVAFILTLVLTLVFFALERVGLHVPRWDELGTYMLALWAGAYTVLSWKYR